MQKNTRTRARRHNLLTRFGSTLSLRVLVTVCIALAELVTLQLLPPAERGVFYVAVNVIGVASLFAVFGLDFVANRELRRVGGINLRTYTYAMIGPTLVSLLFLSLWLEDKSLLPLYALFSIAVIFEVLFATVLMLRNTILGPNSAVVQRLIRRGAYLMFITAAWIFAVNPSSTGLMVLYTLALMTSLGLCIRSLVRANRAQEFSRSTTSVSVYLTQGARAVPARIFERSIHKAPAIIGPLFLDLTTLGYLAISIFFADLLLVVSNTLQTHVYFSSGTIDRFAKTLLLPLTVIVTAGLTLSLISNVIFSLFVPDQYQAAFVFVNPAILCSIGFGYFQVLAAYAVRQGLFISLSSILLLGLSILVLPVFIFDFGAEEFLLLLAGVWGFINIGLISIFAYRRAW